MRSLCVVLTAGFMVVACADPALRRPGTPTATTAGSVKTVHTVDNAGFVDNAGRASSDYPMGELGGARPTEGGGRPPAASPSTVPLPVLANDENAFAAGTTAPPTGAATLAGDDHDDRLGRATCDRELACNRVGVGKKWKSQDSCAVHYTEESKTQLGRAACPGGVRNDQLAQCLKAVRLAPCGGGPAALDSIPACRASALCAQ